jgi:hypothetical protein
MVRECVAVRTGAPPLTRRAPPGAVVWCSRVEDAVKPFNSEWTELVCLRPGFKMATVPEARAFAHLRATGDSESSSARVPATGVPSRGKRRTSTSCFDVFDGFGSANSRLGGTRCKKTFFWVEFFCGLTRPSLARIRDTAAQRGRATAGHAGRPVEPMRE